jgi:hypothetical protein
VSTTYLSYVHWMQQASVTASQQQEASVQVRVPGCPACNPVVRGTTCNWHRHPLLQAQALMTQLMLLSRPSTRRRCCRIAAET